MVLGIIGVVAVLFCGGIGILGYWAAARMANGTSDVTLPERSGGFQADAEQFNRTLANLAQNPFADPTIPDAAFEAFLDRAIQLAENDDTVPFSETLFVAAVSASPFGQGQIGILDRIMLRTWLSQAPPSPSLTVGHHRIADVRLDPAGNRAEVDLLSYDPWNQCESLTWYFGKEEGKWKIYDWQKLEFGRRISDEYAAYVRGDPPKDSGFDEAVVQVSEAESAWYDDRKDEARLSIRLALQKPMLQADRPEFELRVAYTWMRLEQWQEALSILESMKNPDSLWGVWPSMAICYWNLDRNKEALATALKAETLMPNHPNVNFLLAEVYDRLGSEDKAADHAIRALAICSNDTTLLSMVLQHGRQKDVADLIAAQRRSVVDYGWTRIVDKCYADQAFGRAMLEEIAKMEDAPLGLVDLVEGELSWASEANDKAAKHFLAARSIAELPALKTLASENHQQLRLGNGDFEALFREAPDQAELIESLTKQAYSDELYCDCEKLVASLSTLESDPPNRWLDGLKGYALYMDDQYEKAIEHFDAFADWIKTNPDVLTSEEEWISETIDYYIVSSLNENGQPVEAIERYPDDVVRHDQVGSYLLSNGREESIVPFLASTANSAQPSVKLQRLRLMANKAMQDGKAEVADKFHREAIQIGRTVYGDDQDYLQVELIRKWAKDLVRTRFDSLAMYEFSQLDHLQTFFFAAMAEAASLQDHQQIAKWSEDALNMGIMTSESAGGIHEQIGNYYAAVGDDANATDFYQQAVAATDASEQWQLRDRTERAVLAMLRSDQANQANDWLRSVPLSDDSIPLSSLIDLATENEKALMATLESAGDSDANDWMARSAVRQLLQEKSDTEFLGRLLSKYPASISYVSPVESGQLLLASSANDEVGTEPLERILRSVFDESFEVVRLAATEPEAEPSFLAVSDSGQRIVLQWSQPKFVTTKLPKPLANRLSQNVDRLSISVIDSLPKAKVRLFQIAQVAAAEDGILFSLLYEPNCWIGPDLKSKLQWKDRMPIAAGMQTVALTEQASESDDSGKYVTIEKWAAKLADSGGSLDVTLTVSTTYGAETIRAKLTRVDIDTYDVFVIPERDSLLDPIVKAGFEYSTYISSLSIE